MVDNSGSTATSNKSVGTDPNFTYRALAVQSFLNTYGNGIANNISYSYSFFSGNPISYDLSQSQFEDYPSMPFFNATILESALSAFENASPSLSGSGTNYQNAFGGSVEVSTSKGGVQSYAADGLQTLIANDMAANPNENYIVVFMSDGQPNAGSYTTQSDLKTMVGSFVSGFGKNSAGQNKVTVSTVYFGPEVTSSADTADQNGIDILSAMATAGGGQFVNARLSTNFTIDQAIPGTCSASGGQ